VIQSTRSGRQIGKVFFRLANVFRATCILETLEGEEFAKAKIFKEILPEYMGG
jgi:uncharacterized UPF0146 family protein